VLCEAGDNVLVPRPGFPLALPIAENLGINLKYYDLDVSKAPSLFWAIARILFLFQIPQNGGVADFITQSFLKYSPSVDGKSI
jgi:hypothetical protein